jgi:thioredoxin 1
MEHLNMDSFQEKIYDYKNNTDWNYKGERPCIIDFYADWCGPCRMVAPILEELSVEFDGKVDIYKVNTEQEPDLAGMFDIRSIPSLLFVPKTGKPQMLLGALPKAKFVDIIEKTLLA